MHCFKILAILIFAIFGIIVIPAIVIVYISPIDSDEPAEYLCNIPTPAYVNSGSGYKAILKEDGSLIVNQTNANTIKLNVQETAGAIMVDGPNLTAFVRVVCLNNTSTIAQANNAYDAIFNEHETAAVAIIGGDDIVKDFVIVYRIADNEIIAQADNAHDAKFNFDGTIVAIIGGDATTTDFVSYYCLASDSHLWTESNTNTVNFIHLPTC